MTYPEDTLANPGDPSAQAPLAVQAPLTGVGDLRGADHDGHEPVRLSVTIRDLPEATVVAVGGELDLLTAPQLAAELEPVIAADHRHIAIDLTETTFMDSAGIHALVNISNLAPRHFAVICPDGTVRRTIELVGLAEPLCVVDSLDEYRRRRAGS
ncbi:MAG TPA: STAS domain-containing protein [Solirubrobacteraceae bacterium]|nr:STAS domain-containing protein [Solirubrobacteraceae bacterium]